MVKILKVLCVMFIGALIIVFGINFYVIGQANDNIISSLEGETYTFSEKFEKVKEGGFDCAIVLGAAVKPDGTPSAMLRDRLDYGIYLYKKGIVPKLLLSGDNGQVEYNEVKAMFNYVVEAGVKKEDVFCDYAGFSTYESMYRARDVFKVERAIVVTQQYHLYRALYIGNKLGMDVYGAAANQKEYSGQGQRSVREVLARNKDFIKCIYKPEPTYLGETIDIRGSGKPTWD